MLSTAFIFSSSDFGHIPDESSRLGHKAAVYGGGLLRQLENKLGKTQGGPMPFDTQLGRKDYIDVMASCVR
jgi:hypothetical protein